MILLFIFCNMVVLLMYWKNWICGVVDVLEEMGVCICVSLLIVQTYASFSHTRHPIFV